MPTNEFTDIKTIKDFKSLVKYLRRNLNWPVDEEEVDDLSFEYRPAELGIDERLAVKVKEIKQLRPLTGNQPWGVFWIQFEQKRLPVVVMRRILSALVKKQRGQKGHQKTWNLPDLMFISATGEGNERGISFAHFQEVDGKPQLRTFAWDVKETHLYYIQNLNLNALRWPADDGKDADAWREQWSEAFSVPHRYVPTTAEMLAKKMAQIASYIREAVKTIYGMEHAGGSLHQLHLNLKLDLISDLSEDDFADMYAQTVTYGLFAARATRSGDFSRSDAKALIEHTNPFLRELLEQMTNQQSIDLDELGVTELTDLLGRVNMEAILQSFGRQKRGEDPVIHFYETFMKEYDPAQKTKRGEFYTPDAVVSFIVRSVDYLLRTEFDCPDGLATPAPPDLRSPSPNSKNLGRAGEGHVFSPVILDPATGTGTFLKYVIEVIWETFYEKNKKLSAKERREKWNRFVRENVLPRLYAFELKMSPYTIAHMKVGLALQEKGFDFDDNERLQIFLSNALQPAHEVARVDTVALAHESEQANEVKNKASITIVIGNPPYSGHSANASKDSKGDLNFIGNLLQDYYKVDGKPLGEKNPKWLQDDYVKFIRFAQWRINRSGSGIVAMITNHGYLGNPTFRGMRQQLIQSFDKIYILDLHGNSKKKEISPDSSKDENVFDIQQGVAICLMVKGLNSNGLAKVFHADLFGLREVKYEWLMARHSNMGSVAWHELNPNSPFYLFTPEDADLRSEYDNGWRLPDAMPINAVGLVTARDNLTIQMTPSDVIDIVKDFSKLPVERAREKFDLGEDVRDWKVSLAQNDIKKTGIHTSKVAAISYRPFDIRYTYYTGQSRGFICMPRPEVMGHMLSLNNIGLISARSNKSPSPDHFFLTRNISEAKCGESTTQSCLFPLYIKAISKSGNNLSLPGFDSEEIKVNFSREFVNDIATKTALTYINKGDGNLQNTFGAEDVFHYMYAVFHSPTYRSRYAEFLKIDFPRLPLTSNVALFRQLCGLGKELVGLHLLEFEGSKFKVEGLKFVIGPGMSRKVEKGYPKYENGHVFINPIGSFRNVPEEVWNFHIGGYQVCHKWLKDRRGRELSDEDIVHYQKVVVALKETIRLMGEVDAVIEVHGGWPIK